MANSVSFYPMNMLVKGKAADIEAMLKEPGLPKYKLAKDSTFNPKKVKENDETIVEARVIFEMYNEAFMMSGNMPINKYPVRFLIMGCGGDQYRSNGTYAIFKDYAEAKPSVALHFEKCSNPHMEEFEGQEKVIMKVWESFLDKEWSFRYEDYSCGEYVPYAFRGKKAKELIELWNKK